MQIGVQLYTVANYIKNLEDLEQTLQKVADIGYKSVQISGACPYDPYWMRDMLQKNDLICALTHVNPTSLIEDTERIVKEHSIYNCRHIGIGGMPMNMRGSVEGYQEFKKVYLPAALKMRELGAKLLYHNHWFEFDKLDGKDVIQRILEDFPEDSIDFTLDIGWAHYAGADIEALITELSGRLSRIHLKDYTDVPDESKNILPVYLRPIYEGGLDYTSYINKLKNVGCEYALVEQDICYEEDPFKCLLRSYVNITERFPEMK